VTEYPDSLAKLIPADEADDASGMDVVHFEVNCWMPDSFEVDSELSERIFRNLAFRFECLVNAILHIEEGHDAIRSVDEAVGQMAALERQFKHQNT